MNNETKSTPSRWRRWLFCVAIIVAWLGLVLLDMRCPFGIIVPMMAMMAVLMLSGLVLAVSWLIRMTTFRRPRAATWLACFVFSATNLAACSAISNWKQSRSIENAAPLIVAIDRYTAAHGTCPSDLDDLVPAYIAELPRAVTAWKPQPFRYIADDGTEYSLYFPVHDFTLAMYDSASRTWRIND